MASLMDTFRKLIGASKGVVDKIRAEIEALRAERHSIESAPPTEAEAVAALDAKLDGLVARFNSRFMPSWLVKADPRQSLGEFFTTMDPNGMRTEAVDIAALFALLKPYLREGLVAMQQSAFMIEAPGLPVAERRAKLAEIDAAILELERREEATIVQAIGSGMPMERRPDANPIAVLEFDDSSGELRWNSERFLTLAESVRQVQVARHDVVERMGKLTDPLRRARDEHATLAKWCEDNRYRAKNDPAMFEHEEGRRDRAKAEYDRFAGERTRLQAELDALSSTFEIRKRLLDACVDFLARRGLIRRNDYTSDWGVEGQGGAALAAAVRAPAPAAALPAAASRVVGPRGHR